MKTGTNAHSAAARREGAANATASIGIGANSATGHRSMKRSERKKHMAETAMQITWPRLVARNGTSRSVDAVSSLRATAVLIHQLRATHIRWSMHESSCAWTASHRNYRSRSKIVRYR